MEKKLTVSGAKAYQRDDDEDRAEPYMLWHRKLSRGLYMTDVDTVEWRFRGGELVAVGVIEVTQAKMDREVNQRYLAKVIERFENRDLQARATRKIAAALKTKAYIVVFREDCSEFWVYNLTDQTIWKHFDPKQMEDFLLQLK